MERKYSSEKLLLVAILVVLIWIACVETYEIINGWEMNVELINNEENES